MSQNCKKLKWKLQLALLIAAIVNTFLYSIRTLVALILPSAGVCVSSKRLFQTFSMFTQCPVFSDLAFWSSFSDKTAGQTSLISNDAQGII